MKFYEWEKLLLWITNRLLIGMGVLGMGQDYEIPFDGVIKIDQTTQNWIRPDDDVTVEMMMNARVL